MVAPDGSVILPDVFERNLAALRQRDPQAAETLAAVAVPDSVVPCRGRDASPTYRVLGPDGRQHWFGGTSAPSVSAPALLSGFDAGAGNVLLFGIGHGAEAALLLRRLEPQRGLLVIEPDPLNAALALRLHDFHDDIVRGRLVFLLCPLEAAEAALTEFLCRHDGYCCPERMLRWPWHAAADVPALRAVIERAAAVAGRHRAGELAALRERPPVGLPAEHRGGPRVAVVAVMAAPTAWEWVRDAADAGRSLGWATRALTVQGPDDCHVLRLARELHAFGPDWILAIRTGRQALGPAVAATTPIVSWLDLSSAPANHIAAALGPNDRVCATSAAVRDALASAGVPESRLRIVPRAAPSAASVGPAPSVDRPYDVAVLADIAPADPAAVGLALHTQQVLWRECMGIIRQEAEVFTGDRAEPVLDLAERRTGMAIREKEVRGAFCDLIAQTLGPTAVAVEFVRRLAAAGVEPCLWGRGWDAHAETRPFYRGPLEGLDDVRRVLEGTKLYVSLGTWGDVGRDVWLAILCGVVVLWRHRPSDGQEGGMERLLAEGREYVGFRRSADLVAGCKKLLTDNRMREEICRAARARAEKDHGMAGRLKKIQLFVNNDVIVSPVPQ